MIINKRIGNSLFLVGRFETKDSKLIVTHDYFNLLVCLYGFGFAVLKHIPVAA